MVDAKMTKIKYRAVRISVMQVNLSGMGFDPRAEVLSKKPSAMLVFGLPSRVEFHNTGILITQPPNHPSCTVYTACTGATTPLKKSLRNRSKSNDLTESRPGNSQRRHRCTA